MTKEEFIGNYLDKHMKNHGLDYGMHYMNKVATLEGKAEKAWERRVKKLNTKKLTCLNLTTFDSVFIGKT